MCGVSPPVRATSRRGSRFCRPHSSQEAPGQPDRRCPGWPSEVVIVQMDFHPLRLKVGVTSPGQAPPFLPLQVLESLSW